MLLRGREAQFGVLAVHTVAAKSIRERLSSLLRPEGNSEDAKFQISGSVLGLFRDDLTEKTRWSTRAKLVSTSGKSCAAPKHSTAFAMYSPTPGRLRSCCLSNGTPPVFISSLASRFIPDARFHSMPSGVINFLISGTDAFARLWASGYAVTNFGNIRSTCFLVVFRSSISAIRILYGSVVSLHG